MYRYNEQNLIQSKFDALTIHKLSNITMILYKLEIGKKIMQNTIFFVHLKKNGITKYQAKCHITMKIPLEQQGNHES